MSTHDVCIQHDFDDLLQAMGRLWEPAMEPEPKLETYNALMKFILLVSSIAARIARSSMPQAMETVRRPGAGFGKMRKELRKKATQRAFTISLLAATIFPPDLDRLLQEGHFSMAKAIASDEKPGTAAKNTMPPARDPKLAVEEEYQLARRLNTVQSLELFIARHPDDPLAAKARADLRRLSR